MDGASSAAFSGKGGLAGTAPRRQQGRDADPGQSAAQQGAVSLGCPLLPRFTAGHGTQSFMLGINTGLLQLAQREHRAWLPTRPGVQQAPR